MEDKEVNIVVKSLPENVHIAREVLDILRNDKTKVVETDNLKGNYYSFVNDTIYISKIAKNASDSNRGIVICHECIHSVQNKCIQVFNTIFSHLLLISYILSVIFIFLNIKYLPMLIILSFVATIIAQYLEMNATYRSGNLLKKYVANKLGQDVAEKVYNYFSKRIKLGMFGYSIKIIFDKIVPILVIIIINIIKCHIFN